MSEVVLKGEIHTSSGDFGEERQLLKEGFDAVVFEGAETDPEYRFYEGWFNLLIILFAATIGHLYQDKTILRDLAEVQDMSISFTRESDAEVLRNTPVLIHLLAAVLFYAIILASIIGGTVTGNLVSGAFWLLGAVAIPLLLIRIYNTKLGKGSKNRDGIIANVIRDAADEHDRVIAIVGAAHAPGIKARLPDEIDVEYKSPVYGVFSLKHGRDVLRPAFTGFAELFLIYLIIFYTTHSVLL
jgi:hypothetical protein